MLEELLLFEGFRELTWGMLEAGIWRILLLNQDAGC